MSRLLVRLAFLAPFLSSPIASAQADDPPEGPPLLTVLEHSIRLEFDDERGTTMAQFIEAAQEVLGKTFDYDRQTDGHVVVRCKGAMDVPKHEFWSAFQTVLRAHDYVVVPYGRIASPDGPPLDAETGLYAIRSLRSGQGGKPGYVKSQAPVVPREELARHEDDTGLVFTTTFRLEHVHCQDATNMLQTYFTDPMLESIRAVVASNTIVATGFASTLNGIDRLLRQIDVAPPPSPRTLARIPLRHAVAREILPIVAGLAAVEPTGARAGAPPALVAPPPRIELDPRTNALLVLATADDLVRVRRTVEVLDVEIDEPGAATTLADTRVRALAHAPADELAGTLTRWARESGAAERIRFVPDVRTNSLLITCPADARDAVDALLAALDVPTGE